MKFQKLKWIFAFAVGLLGAKGTYAIETMPPLQAPELETLANGMQVIWYVNDALPVIDVSVVVKAGLRDDPKGKSGTSEILADLLERGAGGLSANQIAESLEFLGASRSSSSGDDQSAVGVHGLAADWKALVDVLARMATQADFPEPEITREKARLEARWKQIGDSPDSLASIAFSRAMHSGTAYGRGAVLTLKELGKISRSDLVSFYKKYWTPKNSVLLIVGRVDRPALRSFLNEKFGGWKGPAPKRTVTPYRDPRIKAESGQILVVDRAGFNQAQVMLGLPAPSLRSHERYSLAVLNTMLGEMFHSRLNTVIRDQLGLTYGISSGFNHEDLSSSLTIASATRSEQVGPLILKTKEILKNLRDGEISEAEVQLAKDYLTGGFPLSVATLSAVANRWLNGYLMDLGPDYFNGFISGISSVSLEDVKKSAQKWLTPDKATLVVGGDGAGITKSLNDAGLKSWKKISPENLY